MDWTTIITGGGILIALLGSIAYLRQKPKNYDADTNRCVDGLCSPMNRQHILTNRSATATQKYIENSKHGAVTGAHQSQLGSGARQHGLTGNEQRRLGDTEVGIPVDIPAKKTSDTNVPRYPR